MKASVGGYVNFKALVNKLAAPDAVAYTGDGTNATGAWAFWKPNLCVSTGGNGSSIGVTEATLLGDFAAAVKITDTLTVLS